jgi:transcription elongation factor Elf1
MIINKISAICPVCDQHIEIEIESLDTKIESFSGEILLSFKCNQCDEYIDQEAWEEQ